jgi:hypothetical protein
MTSVLTTAASRQRKRHGQAVGHADHHTAHRFRCREMLLDVRRAGMMISYGRSA